MISRLGGLTAEHLGPKTDCLPPPTLDQGSSEKVSAPWAVAGSPAEAGWVSSQPEDRALA